MSKDHQYKMSLVWTGNKGEGTSNYRSYERDHTISSIGKPEILSSSDPSFRGDPSKYNPEEMLVASLASCHMLWYLHLCAMSGVVVMKYEDSSTGIMEEDASGGGRFREVTLHPVVTVSEAFMIDKANALHHEAHAKCFIANSVNFEVKHAPTCNVVNSGL